MVLTVFTAWGLQPSRNPDGRLWKPFGEPPDLPGYTEPLRGPLALATSMPLS